MMCAVILCWILHHRLVLIIWKGILGLLNLLIMQYNFRIVAEAVLGYILALPDTAFSSDSHVSSSSSLLARDAVDRQLLAHFVRQVSPFYTLLLM